MKRGLVVTMLAIFLVAGTASAGWITIDDRDHWSSGLNPSPDWWDDPADGDRDPWHEDQETEPGTISNQSWDLEGFIQAGTTLSIVGGYDYQNGVSGHPYSVPDPAGSGDIFLYRGGAASFDWTNRTTWDYVVDIDWQNLTWNAFFLSGDETLAPVSLAANIPESNPWRITNDPTPNLLGSGNVTITTHEGVYGSQTGSQLGPDHYRANVDISWLVPGILGTTESYIAHFTMYCGNDSLYGQGTGDPDTPDIPEPTTVALLGLGLAGVLLRKRFWA